MAVAVVTGGSAGLGRALTRALAARGWTVIIDGRDAARLAEVAGPGPGIIVTVPGDVTDDGHRGDLAAAVRAHGGLDLLVHNAGTLGPVGGPTRLPRLADATEEDLRHVWRTNVAAPLALTERLVADLRGRGGVLVAITSDAAVEHYPGWGLYGATKAALEHLVLTFAAEGEEITAYAVDPGDLRTRMQAEAFPDEDLSDRLLPEAVAPHLLALLDDRPPSGRYRAADFAPRAEVPV